MASPSDVAVNGEGWSYIGQVLPNSEIRHGRGILTKTDGERYEGEWANHKRQGYGVCSYPNGDRYEGEWHLNQEHGHGILALANYNMYEGEFREGLKGGRGVARHGDGRIFDGVWAGDCPVRGTAMEASGALTSVAFRTGAFIWSAWDDAARAPAGWVVDGRPPRGGGGRWRGAVHDVAGTLYEGELQWLRACGEGVLTEGGATFLVKFPEGTATLAQGAVSGRMPAPALKEVRTPRRAAPRSPGHRRRAPAQPREGRGRAVRPAPARREWARLS
jgi:hypothetical protein